MAKTDETPKPVRYRETEVSEPSGFGKVIHKLRERVVETTGEIPEGAEPTTDEPHDWRKVTD